jgi:hypothetical protein
MKACFLGLAWASRFKDKDKRNYARDLGNLILLFGIR